MHKVSICIPVYNRDILIKKALESSINQTYRNIEIIVCDNCSTDRTKEVVLEYVKKDNRIKFFENEKNIGALKNFKKTIELSTGDFVVLLGSDDWLSQDFVSSRLKGFEICPEAAFVSGAMSTNKIFDDNTYEKHVDYKYVSSKLSKEYVYDNFYKKFLLSYFCLFRREDILENFAMDFSNENNWEIYNTGYGLDIVNCLNILKKYKYIYYTADGVYNFGSPSDRESENIISDNMNLNNVEPIIKVIDDYKYITYLFQTYFLSLGLNTVAKKYVNYKFLQLLYEIFRSVLKIKNIKIINQEVLYFMNMINISKYETIIVILKLPLYSVYRVYKHLIRKIFGLETR